MSNIVLKLEGINKSFSSNRVLKDINITLQRGTITGLVGKNGAGKTTMIKCMLGLLKPDSGTAVILGDNAWNLSVDSKHRIGYVPQVLTGFRWMRIENMLEYTGSFYSNWNTEKVQSLLYEWDLDPRVMISSLSVGERQKLAIIQAMGHDPDFFIFDEPVASLDPVARRQFIKQLIDLNVRENKTMLFSTHITSDLERIAADIIFLKKGEILFNGDLAQLKERVCRVHIKSIKALPAELPVSNIINSTKNSTSATLTVDGISRNEIKNMEDKLAAVVTVEQLNLEEIFLELNK